MSTALIEKGPLGENLVVQIYGKNNHFNWILFS